MRSVLWVVFHLVECHFTLVGAEVPLAQGFIELGAGLSVGLAGLAAGFAIGIVGDAGVRGTAQQPRLFVGMVNFVTYFLPVVRLNTYLVDFDSHLRRSARSLRYVPLLCRGIIH